MTSSYRQLLILCAISSLARAYIVIAPNQLVAGNEETILVINNQNQVLRGEVTLYDNPKLRDENYYSPKSVELQPGKIAILKFQIRQDFTPFIDLVANLNGKKKTKTLMVSQKSGHLFLQTDKPVYSPKETAVHIRFMATDENLLPANRTYRLQVKNPDNQLALSQDFYDSTRSLFSLNFTLPEDPMLGEWKVSVLYGDGFKQSELVTFNMQEYVLPTFRVDVDMPETLISSMKSIPVKVKATHVYGKPVKGQAMIKEFISSAVGDPQQHQSAGNWTLLDEEGEAEFQVDLTNYQTADDWQPTVKEKRLLIEAVVIEKSTSKQESGFSDRALFARNLYKIRTSMQPEIRPGFPALATIQVRHPNNRIASDVAVELKALDDDEKRIRNLPEKLVRTDRNGLASFLIPTLTRFKQIRVSLEVGNPPHTSTHTATLKAYQGREYIALKKIPVTKKFSVGDSVESEVYFHGKASFAGVTVMTVNGGKIIEAKEFSTPTKDSNERFAFPVKSEMSPMTRIIAVAWKHNGEVLIDSFSISVEYDCRHADYTLGQSIIPNPGGSGDIEISGARRGTIVGLMAIDEAVYAVRSGNILTRDSIFSKLKTADRGCKDGGGIDFETSASYAGIVVFTDEIDFPNAESCHSKEEKKRKRREAIVQRYNKNPFEQKCCDLALGNYFVHKTCEERGNALILEFRKNNTLRAQCQRAFLDCCRKELLGFVRSSFRATPTPPPEDTRARVGDDGDVVEESIPETKVRQDFRESFLFQEVVIEDSSKNIRVTLPHSITTWSIQSIAVNPRGGVCAAPPIQVATAQNFFLQVDLPYKVVRNEHVLIKVSLYNYNNDKARGNLYIIGVNDVCTQARPGERSDAIRFEVAANSAYKVDIPVFPLKEGFYPLRIEVISLAGSDAVVKELYVVPEGREVRQSYSVAIDPTNIQRRRARSVRCGPSCKSKIDPVKKNQTITIDTSLPEDVVENTPQVKLSFIGENMGPAVHASVNDINSLVSLPKGCGEQNMMRLAPLVFIAEYTKKIGKLTPNQEAKIKQSIMQAYSRQMTFRKADGSFCAFRNRGSSVWLTAFVAKVYCRASQFFPDPQTFPETARGAIAWLASKQNRDGSFTETKPILHKRLLGGVKGKVALTSFVTAAFDECNLQLPSGGKGLVHHKKVIAARNFLMRNYDETTDGYTAALVAYALSRTNYSTMALNRMRGMMVNDPQTNTITIDRDDALPWVTEGNAYALLAATNARQPELATPIFHWLSARQTIEGGYHTTQDTVVALQALSEFLASNPQPAVDLSLHVRDGQNDDKILRVSRESAFIPQTLSSAVASDKLEVHATGHGSGLLSVLIKYNTLIPPTERCPFNVTISSVEDDEEVEELEACSWERHEAERTIDVLLSRHRHRREKRSVRGDQLVYRLEVCAYLLGDTPTAMSIVRVDMITGYEAIKKDLRKLRECKRIEKFDLLPDQVVLYVNEFEPKRNTCFSFRVVQQFTVVNAQPAAVSVYDYYNKVGNCPIFYSLSATRRVLVECDGDSDKMCKCLQNSCPPRYPFDVKIRANLTSTAYGRHTARQIICTHDFVVEGKVLEMSRDQRTLFFKMNITHAWREKFPMAGSVITFMQKEYCQNLMATGLSYMVFGDETIPHRGENGTLHKAYSLNEKSRVFYPSGMIDNDIKGNFDVLKAGEIDCT